MGLLKPGKMSGETIKSKIATSLSWVEMCRDIMVDIISKANDEDRRLIVGNCSDIISDLSNAIESHRALLGLPPETIIEEDCDDD